MNDQRDAVQRAGTDALALSDSLNTLRQVVATSSCTSVAEIVTETVNALVSHQEINGCTVFAELDTTVRWNSSMGAHASSGMPSALETRLLTEVFPMLAENATAHREPFLSEDGGGCMLAVPIGKGEAVVGCLAVWNKRPNHFLPWHETLLNMISEVLLLTLLCGPAGSRQFTDYRGFEDDKNHLTAAKRRLNGPAKERLQQIDSLTGLSDRRAFEVKLHELSALPMQGFRSCFLLFVDIDRFRLIREYGGHTTAEHVIKTLSEILQHETETELALARLGMDEFGVVVERHSLEQAVALANALVNQVDAFKIAFAGQRYHVSISIGVAELDAIQGVGTSALGQAKQACRAAQSLGGGMVQVYHERLVGRRGAGNDGWILNRLTHALKNDGLELYAQLISPLGKENEAGALMPHMHELLLRLRDEKGEIRSAGTFLPVAERYGLSVKIDRWVIESAVRQIADSTFAENEKHRFTLNLSGHSIDNHQLLDFIIQQLEESSLPPERICFEITETAAISDIAAAKEFIEALRRIGCQFALDDFGSGHSSFLYLRDLPVDYLKIDGELVREIVKDPVSLSFVRTIEGVGRVMGRQTIAENVQSQDIYNAISAIGCDYVQGYWIGYPVPLAEVLSKPHR